MDNKKQLIQAFRASKYGLQPDGSVSSGQNELREDLTNAVEQLSTGLYEKNVHFLMELIQNAEDNDYPPDVQPQLKLVLLNNDPTLTPGSDGCLCVFNNETGFNHENIKGISGVGKSTKKKQDGYIGEKGIGFKSVFIVSMSPHIFSNGYQIRFLEKDEKFDLNYIVPYWVDVVPEAVLNEGMTTSLLLPLKPGKKTEIIEHLKNIKPESLLFLKKLRQLSIEMPGESIIQIAASEPENDVVELSTVVQGEATTGRYWMYNETVEVPQYLKEGDNKEEKREGIDDRNITLALPLDKSEVEGKVFAYLPTEVDSGLPFIINSDFLLTANRESFQSDRPWNQWLKDEMAGIILNALEKMRLQPEYRKTFYRYIPLKKDLKSLPEYFLPIIEAVVAALKEKQIVLTVQGELFRACDTRFPKKKARQLFVGASLPGWFQATSFVDPELGKFADQIKEIDGKELGKVEFPLILDDKVWLDEQSESWFVQLWGYLGEEKYKKKLLEDKYILPVSRGVRKRAKDLIFYAYDPELIASIPEEIKGFVNFLPKDFADEGLFNFLKSGEFIHHFSLDNFVVGTLIPHVEKEIKEKEIVKIDWFMEINRFLCGVLPDPNLGDESRRVIKNRFYILDEKNTLVSLANDNNGQILYPRGFDDQFGWQLFFDSEKDCDACKVLSKEYLTLFIDDKTKVAEFFRLIGATARPQTKLIEYETWNQTSSAYTKHAFSKFNRTYTNHTWPTLKYHKNIENFEKAYQENVSRRAYIRWLEFFLGKELFRSVIEYQYYDRNIASVDESAIVFQLKRESWIKTQLGFKRPGEVFIESDSVREILGNNVPYLKDEMSESLHRLLGVKESASSSDLIQYLRDSASYEGEVDQKVLVKVYRHLDSVMGVTEDFQEIFAEEPLIYVPDRGWMPSGQTIWEDGETVFGSSHGWLSKHYPNALEDFFVDKVGVKKQVDDETYIDAWLMFQERTVTSEAEVEGFIIEAMPRIIKMIKSDPENPALQRFQEEALLWTRDRTWIDPYSLYIPDNNKLTRVFEDDLCFVWRLPGKSFEHMSPLLEYLEVQGISDAVEYSINDVSGSGSRKNELLTKHAIKLLAYFLNNTDRDETGVLEERFDDGFFEKLYRTDEVVVSNLVISVSVGGYSAELVDQCCYLDLEACRLYIDDFANPEDVKEELATILKRKIFGGKRGSFEDTILRLLAVSSEKREAKIREDKGWHLPRELLKELNAIDKSISGVASSEKIEKPLVPPKKHPTSQNTDSRNAVERSAEPEKTELPIGERTNQAESNQKAWETRDDGGSSNSKVNHSPKPIISEPSERRPQSKSSNGSTTSSPRSRTSGNPGTSQRTSPHRPVSYSKAGNSKSNRKTNIRTGRLRSYVSKERREGEQPASSRNEYNKLLGDTAEKIVLRDLLNKGFGVKEMPTNNKGYDFEAINRETGELFYIEVKGSYAAWSEKGVAISKSQYQQAEQYQENFILAVVDNLQSTPSQPVYLRNPVGNITEYRFDDGWAEAGVNFVVDKNTPQQKLVNDPVADRIALTDSEVCKALLSYCDDQGYPIPEVGVELTDSDGVIVCDPLELSWDEERIGIVLSQEELEYAQEVTEGWTFWVAGNLQALQERLDETFG